MKSKQIKITISGNPASGKSTLKVLIGEYLSSIGYNVKVNLYDEKELKTTSQINEYINELAPISEIEINELPTKIN